MSRDTCQRCPETSHWRPRQDSNLRSRLRRAVLYPLSYGGRASQPGSYLVKGRKAMYQRSRGRPSVSYL